LGHFSSRDHENYLRLIVYPKNKTLTKVILYKLIFLIAGEHGNVSTVCQTGAY